MFNKELVKRINANVLDLEFGKFRQSFNMSILIIVFLVGGTSFAMHKIIQLTLVTFTVTDNTALH